MNASTAKPLEKYLTGDKSLGLETDIRFYELEDSDNTKEVEYAEILIIQDKILLSTKKNLFKRKFP